MKNITHLDREMLNAALRKHEELIKKSPILKAELELLEKWEKEEKARRDNVYAKEKAEAQEESLEEM